MADMTDDQQLNIDANRSATKWSKKALIGRVLWGAAQPFFALSPRLLWGWRRFLLRAFGARVGKNVQVFPSARITIPWNLDIGDYSAIGDRAIIYALGPIKIGQRVTISQYAHVCAGSHDFRSPNMDLTKPPITIEDDAWVCADVFVGPDIVVGKRAILGARAVVTRNVEPDAIVAGNPAKTIGTRELNSKTE